MYTFYRYVLLAFKDTKIQPTNIFKYSASVCCSTVHENCPQAQKSIPTIKKQQAFKKKPSLSRRRRKGKGEALQQL